MFQGYLARCLLVALAAGPAFGQSFDSVRGADALRNRGCTNCHALMGQGGDRSAPDLGRPTAGGFSPAEFAARLWNHSPAMWAAAESKGEAPPRLDRQEARDVFAYLYSVRYFEPSGNAERGRATFRRKECFRCHALVRTEAGGIGPAVPDWPLLDDPGRFLEAMWNHGAAMQEEGELDGRPWPTLNTRELADLLTYVYGLPDLPPRRARLRLGAPQAGMRLFDDLGCAQCHSMLPGNPDLVALADAPRRNRTLTGLAVEMWNHRPIMQEWANETGVEIARLEEGQMGQLLSYMFEEAVLEARGELERGERVYNSKGCAGCHEQQPLPKREWAATDLVVGAWEHAPAMRDKMREDGLAWPTLTSRDVADLVTWLRAR